MGLPALQALVGGGGSLLLPHIFQAGLENYLGGGCSNQGSGRVFFSLFRRWFSIGILGYLTNEMQFQVLGMPSNAVQCCGVLWSRKV